MKSPHRKLYKQLYLTEKQHTRLLITYSLSTTLLALLVLFGSNRRLEAKTTEIDGMKRRENNILGMTVSYESMFKEADARKYSQPQNPKEIIEYVFGKDAPQALKVFTCESGLRPNAVGKNTNGSIDVGLAQINSIHGIPATYLKNPMINALVAKQIYDRQGWNPWVCAHKLAIK